MVVTYGEDRSIWPAQADLGYYYIPLSISNATSSTLVPQDEHFIRYEVLSVTQDGSLIYTSSGDVARQHRAFDYFTHYMPDYYIMGDNYNYIPRGIADAMRKYKEGDSIRLILPQYLATSSNVTAYITSTGSDSNSINSNNSNSNIGKPVIIDIAIRKVVYKPRENEQGELVAFKDAEDEDLLSPYKGMSGLSLVAEGSDTTDVFFKELIPPSVVDGLTVEDGDTITVRYTGRYLDDYVFETNIADTAKARNIYAYSSKYAELTIIVGENDSDYPAGFNEAIKNMRNGSVAIALFTSDWGAGNTGASESGVTGVINVPYYTSMIYHIWLTSLKKGPEVE